MRRLLGVVLLVGCLSLPAVAVAVEWKPFVGVGASAVASDWPKTTYFVQAEPAAAPQYVGKVLCQRAPVSGDLLPYKGWVEGINSSWPATGAATVGGIPYTNTGAGVWTSDYAAWLAVGLGDPAVQEVRDALDICAAWAAGKLQVYGAVAGEGDDLGSLKIQGTCVFNGTTYPDVFVDISHATYYHGPAYYGAGRPTVGAASVNHALGDVIRASMTTGGGSVVGHGAVPFSVSSGSTVPTGTWVAQVVTGYTAMITIANSKYPAHKWALLAGSGVDFGIVAAPERAADPGMAVGPWAKELYPVDSAFWAGTADARTFYVREILRAWGGRNGDGTYWYAWRVSSIYANGAGMWGDRVEVSGSVASAVNAPVLRVVQPGKQDIAAFYDNGVQVFEPSDLTDTQPPLLTTTVRGYCYAGYQDGLASLPASESLDVPINDTADPAGVVPAVPGDTWGTPNATGTADSIIPDWLGAAWSPIGGWVQQSFNSMVGTISGGLGSAVGGLLAPFGWLGGFK